MKIERLNYIDDTNSVLVDNDELCKLKSRVYEATETFKRINRLIFADGGRIIGWEGRC
jgi:hypothetical protein